MADMVNHPSHYNQGKREVIEEMRILFGDIAVKYFCNLSAYKYIRRADYKGNKEQDLAKAEWYMDYVAKMNDEHVIKYNECTLESTEDDSDTDLDRLADKCGVPKDVLEMPHCKKVDEETARRAYEKAYEKAKELVDALI